MERPDVVGKVSGRTSLPQCVEKQKEHNRGESKGRKKKKGRERPEVFPRGSLQTAAHHSSIDMRVTAAVAWEWLFLTFSEHWHLPCVASDPTSNWILKEGFTAAEGKHATGRGGSQTAIYTVSGLSRITVFAGLLNANAVSVRIPF
ncbi:hypothetical protein CDAR_613741 [Caerostris darwini]|uniref:Uncharacterized protein n=1 Tax=Caerostris darwini TaxID=1538125 RepID=A0AAV4TLD6_9ARAC|nr:hypothetical protein CDAR_613741 [Caerostris darwini]